jgi:nitrite reductase/ring-hydroxylating ferredoxin subunit
MSQIQKSCTTGTQRIEIPLADIPADRPVRVEYGERGIVVVRTVDGVSAFEDSCPHAQWRLSDGELIGGVLECPGHGWDFRAATGDCVNVPAYCLKRFAVSVHNDMVEIKVGGSFDGGDNRPAYDGQAAV